MLVSYCLQFLLILVLYTIPETGRGPPPKNYFRHFLGRLHRPQDFQFLVDGMTRTLNQPVRNSELLYPLYKLMISVVTGDGFVFARQPEVSKVGPGNDHVVLGNFTMQQAV